MACTCNNRSLWYVNVYHGNYSAFNGYRFTLSTYSEIICDACKRRWRTNAQYVEDLPRFREDLYSRREGR